MAPSYRDIIPDVVNEFTKRGLKDCLLPPFKGNGMKAPGGVLDDIATDLSFQYGAAIKKHHVRNALDVIRNGNLHRTKKEEEPLEPPKSITVEIGDLKITVVTREKSILINDTNPYLWHT